MWSHNTLKKGITKLEVIQQNHAVPHGVLSRHVEMIPACCQNKIQWGSREWMSHGEMFQGRALKRYIVFYKSLDNFFFRKESIKGDTANNIIDVKFKPLR